MEQHGEEKLKKRFVTVSGYPFCEKSDLWNNPLQWYKNFTNRPLILNISLFPLNLVMLMVACSVLYSRTIYRLFRKKDFSDL
jgi:hypothetical protein